MKYNEEHTKKIFSKNLKRIMSKNNINQTELSTLINSSPQSVSQWVNGTTLPRMGAIEEICSKLKVSKSDLLDDNSGHMFIFDFSESNNTRTDSDNITKNSNNDISNVTNNYYSNNQKSQTEKCTNEIIITLNTKKYFFGIIDELREMDDDQLLEILKYCEFVRQKK